MSSEPPAAKTAKSEQASLIILLTLLAGGFIAGWIENAAIPVFLCSFIFIYMASVCAHELGHAAATVFLGGDVHQIRLGKLKKNTDPWKFTFLGFPCRAYSLPYSGAVYSSFYSNRFYRLQWCLMIASGPLANLLIILPCLYYLLDTENISERFPAFCIAWLWVNGYLFFNSVIPSTWGWHFEQTNDGVMFWNTLFTPKQEIQRYVDDAVLRRDTSRLSGGIDQLNTSTILKRHEAEPGDYTILLHLVNRLHIETDSRYPKYALALIANEKLPRSQLVLQIDLFLTHQLHLGPPTDPELADRLSQRLIQDEDSPSTRGTRGSVLVDIGRLDEGRKMLHRVLAETTSSVDKKYSYVFLALAEEKLGNLDAAKKYAATAADILASCGAGRRIAHLLSAET